MGRRTRRAGGREAEALARMVRKWKRGGSGESGGVKSVYDTRVRPMSTVARGRWVGNGRREDWGTIGEAFKTTRVRMMAYLHT
jgi:hypothetical protein